VKDQEEESRKKNFSAWRDIPNSELGQRTWERK